LSPAASADFNGTDVTGGAFGKELRLPDIDGKERSLADFKGKAVIAFFGFTQCPDVCPTAAVDPVSHEVYFPLRQGGAGPVLRVMRPSL
jgi:hypothetical protein